VITVSEIQPDDAIVTKHSANLSEDQDEVFDVELIGGFEANGA
jgi:hypothetical protein